MSTGQLERALASVDCRKYAAHVLTQYLGFVGMVVWQTESSIQYNTFTTGMQILAMRSTSTPSCCPEQEEG